LKYSFSPLQYVINEWPSHFIKVCDDDDDDDNNNNNSGSNNNFKPEYFQWALWQFSFIR